MTNPSMDLTPFAEAKVDRVTADDLIGGPRTVKITAVSGAIEEGKKQAIINFEGDDGKPFKPCKTMVRLMMAIWGKYASEYVGRSMTLYRDPNVTFGALATGGVRISHMSHLEAETVLILASKKGKKGEIKVRPLTAEVAPIKTPAKQTAEQWADEQAGAAQVCATLDSLADLIERGAKAMGRLEVSKPDLFAKVNAAYAAARFALDSPTTEPAADMGDFADEGDGA